MPFEKENHDYDCTTKFDSFDNCTSVLGLHDGRIHRSGLKLMMRHHFYPLTNLFTTSTNQTLFDMKFYPFLQGALHDINDCTILFYGQTGTGKTYTMTSLQEQLFHKILDQPTQINVRFGFFEIHNKKTYDLLNERAECKLQSCENGIVNCTNQIVEISSYPQYLEYVTQGLKLRTTLATERNDISSRSHAFLTIYLGFGERTRQVTLIDLAGNERNYEMINHTTELHKETADINKSLSTLKECFKCLTTKKFPPYREHSMTYYLKNCFEDPKHRLMIVGTLSPSTTDIEHSRDTMEYLCNIDGGKGFTWDADIFMEAMNKKLLKQYSPDDMLMLIQRECYEWNKTCKDTTALKDISNQAQSKANVQIDIDNLKLPKQDGKIWIKKNVKVLNVHFSNPPFCQWFFNRLREISKEIDTYNSKIKMRMHDATHAEPEKVKRVKLQDKAGYAAFEVDLKQDDFLQLDQELDNLERKKNQAMVQGNQINYLKK